MDDCVPKDHTKGIIMGACGNADSAKIASLQERKKQIQDKLDKHHKELRKLCLDEAELTGQLPIEYPFEQGEVAPTFRRRIGTSYQLNKNILNNLNNEEEISVLEMEMHMLANMASAAISLANESSSNKAAKKAHMQDYETHMAKHKGLENKLHDLKISASQTFNQNAQKQKKKPRPEKEHHGDSVSMNLNMSDPFVKPFRHSLRSLQYQSTHSMHAHSTTYLQSGQSVQNVKQRPASQRCVYPVPDGIEMSIQQQQHQSLRDYPVVPAVKVEPTFYKLSLDGYKQYEDKQETLDVAVSEGLYRSYPNQGISRTLPHASRRSPQTQAYSQSYMHTMRSTAHSPGTSPSTSSISASSTSAIGASASIKYYPHQVQHVQHAHHPLTPHTQQHQQYAHTRQSYDARVPPNNPLQLQPHQQYENVMTSGATSSGSGLGGYWKQSENGEFWCNNSSSDSMSLKDKRFGSLDRRKNKRLQKKMAASNVSVDHKGALLPVPSYEEATRTLPTKSQAIAARRHETRQLVRTQSLGSVGIAVVDPNQSDDSSCGSENINSDTLRKNKQKEWYETALDAPQGPQSMTPTPSLPPMRSRTHSHSHSIAPSIAPEEKYVDYPRGSSPRTTTPTPASVVHHYQHAQHSPLLPPARLHSPQMSLPPPPLHSPSTPKEIPAESNPSPRVQLENREIFNNNMPKNCTVVQQAQWKPYHEETKPFEMADFYKYSTKYKKKPEDSPSAPSPSSSTSSHGQGQGQAHRQSVGSTGSGFKNLPYMTTSNRTSDVNVNMLGNTSNVNVSNVSNLSNSSFDSHPLSPHVADNFSAEMNAWYQKHEHQADNNNATLV